uniref:Uncharacterized protein n=1 Tax=Oryza nivara TaxID=4536 RepID=A0A0E0H9C2_ORYNI
MGPIEGPKLIQRAVLAAQYITREKPYAPTPVPASPSCKRRWRRAAAGSVFPIAGGPSRQGEFTARFIHAPKHSVNKIKTV